MSVLWKLYVITLRSIDWLANFNKGLLFFHFIFYLFIYLFFGYFVFVFKLAGTLIQNRVLYFTESNHQIIDHRSNLMLNSSKTVGCQNNHSVHNFGTLNEARSECLFIYLFFWFYFV